MSKLRTKDLVRVITGKHKTKEGVITDIINDKWVCIKDIVDTKHFKPSQKEGGKGKMGFVSSKIHISNVSLVVGKDKKISKISYAFNEDGKKIRVERKSKKALLKT